MEDEDDEYISYGTALPEYEDEAILRKKAAKELQVRDEKGRQRFHGAFTGGFSAGFFNTVGTKEGWAPSTFVSSRSKIADRFQQNPEDFMDDEDFGEFGIATRKIHTTLEFQDPSDNVTRKRKFVDNDSVIPGEAPLKDLVKPIRDSIGIQILKKLGWRPGQGIGLRIKKQSPAVKVYGCSLPDTSLLEAEDPTMLSFTFAPEDTDEIFYRPKDNYFGLGYTGLSKQSVLTSASDAFAPTTTKSWLTKDKKKISISGQAFGVGAYEDEDEDIYSKDDMSQYDFSELVPKEKEFESRSKKKLDCENSVLEGFCVAINPASVKKYYPPPHLPPNYKPISKLLQKNYESDSRKTKSRHSLSSTERSFILGEKKFQSVPLNIVKKDVEKTFENQKQADILLLTKNAHNFRPFPNDSDKQQRYESFLKLQSIGETEKLIQPPNMTEWEKQQELEEFTRAAVLFKPLSNALSSRFESRSHLSVEHEVMSALEKKKEEKKEKIPLKKILVGSCNRRIVDWFPASLICKRFNVPNPYPNSSSTGVPSTQKGLSLFDHISFNERSPEETNNTTISSLERDSSSCSAENISKIHDISPKDNFSFDTENRKNLEDVTSENKRPPMDLFKDIFENSSSEDEDSSNKKDNSENQVNLETESESKINSDITCDSPHNVPSQEKKILTPKVGFGVFANLDLDVLNQRTVTKVNVQRNDLETEIEVQTTATSLPKEPESLSSSIDLYGPALPPNYSSSPCPVSFSDKTLSTKHAKHKAKHKHKHKHYKHHKSHKRKKKSSKNDLESSNSSDGDSNDDVDTLIIEKLKKLQKKRV
ncbi:G patch domain-containing protein 1-like [Uloborus diversus]|uniref:G patch domain-containing protein 1-like n=1 Tax=Uloborus diversus TaxID=327109 RepID=UPI0024099A7F|nr:G patch domain-containing protein 1-like [Uloborus diversus]